MTQSTNIPLLDGTTWRLDQSKLKEIQLYGKFNINRMAPFVLPVELLASSEGDASPLSELLQQVRCLQSKYNRSALVQLGCGKIEERLASLLGSLGPTPAAMSRVPTEIVREMLSAVETIANDAQKEEKAALDAQERVSQLEVEIVKVNGKLLALAKLPRFDDNILPAQFVNGDGFRGGWRDWWWESANRLKALETLERKWQQWVRDDESDELLAANRVIFQTQVLAVKEQLSSIDAVQQLKVHQPPLAPAAQQQFRDLLAEAGSLRDQAKIDTIRMEALLADVEQRDAKAAAVFAESQQYLAEFTLHTQEHIEQEQAHIAALDRWREVEVQRIQGRGRPSSEAIAALEREIESLRKTLTEKEERLQREIDVWNRQQLAKMHETIAREMKELEKEYETQLVKSKDILQQLGIELANARAEAQQREVREEERRAELVRLLAQLTRRHDVLRSTLRMYGDLADAADVVHQSWEYLHGAITQFFDVHHMEHQQRVFDLRLEGLEQGGKLSMLLVKLEKNLKDRIKVADTTVKHINALLEFNVDTYDPNAHRWTAVLEGVLAMRRRLQEALAINTDTLAWLREELRPLDQAISVEPGRPAAAAPLRRLQREYPALFDTVLADWASQPGSPASAAPPRSQFVTPLRRECQVDGFSASAFPLSPTFTPDSPHSPLPWVQARHWTMPDVDRPDSRWGFAEGAATSWSGSRAMPNAASPSGHHLDATARSGQLSPATTRFDHREFRLYKALK